MVAAHVAAVLFAVAFASVSHIHLASEYGLEGFFALVLQFAVYLVAVVIQFLHAEHVAVVGYGHAAHAVGYRFIHKFLHGRLSVEYGVIGMDV